MEESTFEKKLADVLKELHRFPTHCGQKSAPVLRSGKKYPKLSPHDVEHIQDSLDYLRVSVKYLLFDLEATRRENADLRHLLSEED
jgi:hypothetical protein